MTPRHIDRPFEPLESRFVLDGDFPFVAYYPEGYASDQINEFVPITNHNDFEVDFELHARYEFGERDQLIAEGKIPGKTRGGVTISEVTRPQDTVVRRREPYSLVLLATAPLSATLSHYDFGTAIGESFTTVTSGAWMFPDGLKKGDSTRDFFLVYNPNDRETSVEFTFYQDNAPTITKTLVLGAQRRGGWAVNDITEVVEGRYSVRIFADAPIVAAESHYDFAQERGFGALGMPEGGGADGIVPLASFDQDFYDVNGDDSGRGVPRFPADGFISILNTNTDTAAVAVTLTFKFEADSLPTQDRTVVVPAASRRTVSLRDLAIPLDAEFAVVYRATAPVAVAGSRFQGMDATGVTASHVAATTWDFAEGYMHRHRAGGGILETITIFNPRAADIHVAVTLMFTDGRTLSEVIDLAPSQLRSLRLHDLEPLMAWGLEEWYGVRVQTSSPIVAHLEHWDNTNGGGFATLGMPSGQVMPFGDALVLPGLPGQGATGGGIG